MLSRKLITGIAAAFAGAALAIPASADVSVSGFMNQRVGFGDYRGGKESDDSIHFRTDAEVLFTGTGTTDGGLKVTARVELEGDSGGDQIDENWLSVEGNFGKVTLGGEDAAVITHGYVGIGSGFGNIGYYDSGDTWTPVGGEIYPVGYSDGQGIRYSTPSVGGFSGAVSFQPEGADGAGSSQTSADNDHSIFSVAGSYSTNMGAMSLTVGGGILSRTDNPDNNNLTIHDNKLGNHWGAGASLGFGANTLHLRMDVREDKNGVGMDQTDWGIQLERAVGSTTFAIGYSQRKDDGGNKLWVSNALEQSDTEYSKVVAGANYSLGGGVTVGAAVAWGEVDRDAEGTPAKLNDDNTAYVAGGGTVESADGTSFGAHIAFSF